MWISQVQTAVPADAGAPDAAVVTVSWADTPGAGSCCVGQTARLPLDASQKLMRQPLDESDGPSSWLFFSYHGTGTEWMPSPRNPLTS